MEALTGHANDDYAGQIAEISGGTLVLRSTTAANTYHLTFVDPTHDAGRITNAGWTPSSLSFGRTGRPSYGICGLRS